MRMEQVEETTSPGHDEQDVGSTGRGDNGRDSMFLQATLWLGHGGDGTAVPVRVRNISAGGLMVEPIEALERGEPVSIDLRGIGIVDGHVAWALEGRMGISFLRPIDPRLTRKPVSGKKPAGGYVPPIVTSRRPGLRID